MSITSNNLKVMEVIHQVINDPSYKKVSHVPLLSFYQVALILIAYISVFGGISLYLYRGVSLWFIYPLIIFGFYTAFTPFHDSTHRAVSSNNLLNDILGTISGFLLFPVSNTPGYRYLHLAHHRYVGDKDLDPDEPMVYIPTKYFPLGYLCLLFPDLYWIHWLLFKAWKRTPVKSRIHVLIMIIGNIIFHTAWFISPFSYLYLILFFIPNRLAIAYTTLIFAHNPHPEGLSWNNHPFQSTFILKTNKYFQWSLYGQKHHPMHHFLPHIPWYNYFKVWDLANGTFQRQNIPEKGLFSKPDIKFKDKILKESANKESSLMATIISIDEVTNNIKTFVFQPANNKTILPEFTAGSHIDVYLPSGKVRSYSCVNPPYEKNKYQIAVKLEPFGKGGSREMHEQVSVGDMLIISYPKNNFLLYENAKKYLLISGGIGITPLLSMSHRLTYLEKHFELHLCAKTEDEIPFKYELMNWTFAPNVEIHLNKKGKSSIDINKILASPNEDILIYICGPLGFNNWVKETALGIGWKKNQIKIEAFSSNNSTELLVPKAFQLMLKKQDKSIMVKQDETIIDALHRNNINVPYSCLQGTCGTCITRVIDGVIDHRDAVLSSEEKTENKTMCICVSRAKDNKLVIDL
jgi:ferredoxin-NADP reductase/fatty acid desaturase